MIFETYKNYERIYRIEQKKAKLRLSLKSADQIRADYEELKKELIEYRDSKSKNHFTSYSFAELICLYVFFWRFQRDLNKLKEIGTLDKDTVLNIISSLHGYKMLLDMLIETNVHRCIGKKEV